MKIAVAEDRFGSRRDLLNSLDGINRQADASGKMEGIDAFEQQAFELVLGSSQDAFDINKDDLIPFPDTSATPNPYFPSPKSENYKNPQRLLLLVYLFLK